MKVLVACDEDVCFFGQEYYVRDFCNTLVRRYLMTFDQVRLVVRCSKVFDKKQLGKNNIKVSDSRIEIWPITNFSGQNQYAKVYFEVKRQLRGVCNGCNLGIFRIPGTTGQVVCNIAQKKGLPYAAELVFDCVDEIKSNPSFLQRALWRILHRQMIVACNKAIGLAPVTKCYLQSHYWSNLPDAINSSYSSIELPNDFFYRSRSFPQKDYLDIVHVSNQVYFNSRKGHNDLIFALVELKKKGILVRVTFVGEDYHDGIAKLTKMAEKLGVADLIKFTGFMNYSNMREVLRKADIAVFPTKAEGLPRVVIEAMAMGLPCLTTRVSGNPELIEDKFLFDYGDVNAIVRIVTLLYCDPNLYCGTSVRNFNCSKEFKKEILDKKRKDFYDQLRLKIENEKIK